MAKYTQVFTRLLPEQGKGCWQTMSGTLYGQYITLILHTFIFIAHYHN